MSEQDRPQDAGAALERLLEGNARFVADRKLNPGNDSGRRAELVAAQAPFAMVLGCADSRVPPEVVFDQGLGDLFVVRVAGNTAAVDAVLGSVEFSLAKLDCPLVVVLGHEGCAAVAGAVEVASGADREPGSIGAAIEPIVPVAESIRAREPGIERDALVGRCIRENVAAVAAGLAERSEIVAARVTAGDARVVGAVYRLGSGEVELLQ